MGPGESCARLRWMSRDPGQVVVHIYLAVRRFISAWLPSAGADPGLLFLTGTGVHACASLQLLFCFPLFSCQGTDRNKSCLLRCRYLETDKRTQEQIHLTKVENHPGIIFLRRKP